MSFYSEEEVCSSLFSYYTARKITLISDESTREDQR